MSARAKCRRKHEYIVIAFKTFLYELRKIAVLRSGNRYRNAERLQPRQKHEKGVHKILQFFAVTVGKHRANAYSVGTSQRMIAYKGIRTVFGGGKIFFTLYLYAHVKVFAGGIEPFHALYVLYFVKILVYFVLVQNLSKPIQYAFRYKAYFAAQLGLKHLFNVYRFYLIV